jgi:hypothetical protein
MALRGYIIKYRTSSAGGGPVNIEPAAAKALAGEARNKE